MSSYEYLDEGGNDVNCAQSTPFHQTHSCQNTLCYNLQQIHSHKGLCHLQSFILHQSFVQLQTFYMHAILLLCIQSSSVFDSLSSDSKKSHLSPYLKLSSPHADSRCVGILRTLPDRPFLWEKRDCNKKRGLPLNPGWLGKKLLVTY